jgi:hypothetical protein
VLLVVEGRRAPHRSRVVSAASSPAARPARPGCRGRPLPALTSCLGPTQPIPLPPPPGFDPLGLGKDASKLKWYVQAELVHSRFAMLAVAGVLFPELASNAGISWPGANVAWYNAGAFEYFAPASALFGVQMLLFAWVEARRCAAALLRGAPVESQLHCSCRPAARPPRLAWATRLLPR